MQRLLHFLSILLVATVGFCLLVVQPFPVLHDYPEWMYQGWLANQLLFGNDASILNLFALAEHPVPNSITQFAVALLNQFASPIFSGKLWLAIYLVFASTLWTLLSFHLQREWSPAGAAHGNNLLTGAQTGREARRNDGAINLLLTTTITFGPGFWNGYANFQFALLFWGAYLLAMRLHRDNVLVHFLLSLLIFFSHASVFIAFAGFVVTRLLVGRLSWRHILAIVPSLLMFGWYLIVTIRLDAVGPVNALGLIEWVQYKVYTVAKQGYFHNFILADGSSLLGDVHFLYLAGVLLNLGVAVVIIIWLLHQSWLLLKAASVFPFNKRVSEITGGNHETNAMSISDRRVTLISLALVQLRCHRTIVNLWVPLAVAGAVYTMIATAVVSQYPVKEYAVVRSTTSSTLDGAIDDIYANSRHKLFNHRLYIYADHGIWLQQPGTDLLPLKHITSFVLEK